ALDAVAHMTKRGALGYRRATAPTDTLLAAAGDTITGHEFHRTQVEPRHGKTAAWEWDDAAEGFASPTLHASYLHVHWAGHPRAAARFAAAVHAHG
ncbi:MAG TPA: cobyrinic acid a,c-diamide synthase, partial [Amycolatopsis sp.]|nr:cobyrinic acid a,c-diamide synthase [Amycolatopsis sp.]